MFRAPLVARLRVGSSIYYSEPKIRTTEQQLVTNGYKTMSGLAKANGKTENNTTSDGWNTNSAAATVIVIKENVNIKVKTTDQERHLPKLIYQTITTHAATNTPADYILIEVIQ